MGCIQNKKLIKISNLNGSDINQNLSNTITIHNIKNESTNNDKKEDNRLEEGQLTHSNSQEFQMKDSLKEEQAKSNNKAESDGIYKLASNDININSNLINKELKFEDKYSIIEEEKIGSYFKTFKIKLIDEKLPKEVFRSMIRIEKDIFGEFTSDKKIAEEISLLSHLNSNYIIKVYECFISNKRYYLITDYCKYGSLNEKLKDGNLYNENQIRYLIFQIFKAINYLTEKNFLHIEISPEKVLIYDQRKDSQGKELYIIKLLDFFCPSDNYNSVLLDNKSTFYCYMAPEVIEQKYSSTCDIWSVGIIAFQMFFGELPKNDNNDFNKYVQTIKDKYTKCNNISYEFKDLLDKILNQDPSKRITIKECLSHPWIHIQNTDIIMDEEVNKQPELLRTNTNQSKDEKFRKKCYKNGKNNSIEFQKMMLFKSEKNNNKSNYNFNGIPLHKNSSSLSDSNSNENSNGNMDEIIETKESTIGKINNNKPNSTKNKNNKHFKSECNLNKLKKKSIKRISSLSADKNLEIKIKNKYPPLIEKTIDYIHFYICINYHKKKEIEKISNIFKELDIYNQKYLLYNKVYFALAFYKGNKKISLETLNNIKVNNDKKYNLEEFIKILLEEKNKYINDNFKKIFDSIKQPNIEEVIKIYKDQEPIDEYRKYVVYIKELVNVIQENVNKTNYVFNEFKNLIDNSINKLYKVYTNKLSCKAQRIDGISRALTRKNQNKNGKENNSIKRSNTCLKYFKKNYDKHCKLRKKNNNGNLNGENFDNIDKPPYSPNSIF